MRVLQFICPSGFYGAELWVIALMKSLDHDVVQSSLVTTRESKEQNCELNTRIKALGFDAFQLNLSGRFDFSAIYKLVKLIKTERIDIIHTHGYKADIIGLIAARVARIKAISTPHGFENAPDLKLKLFISLGCQALKRFDKVVPLSEELMEDMKRIRVEPKRVTFIRNGVDLDEIEEEAALADTPLVKATGEKVIGYVGQMAYRKNVGDMIKAFDLLYKEHKNIRLLLIGDGPKRHELEKMTSMLPCASRIEFLGFRDNRLAYVKEFDLFCMTSSLEGIPRCMMEAMALGVPTAAFEIPGVDKLIINGKTGLMADFGDVSGLKMCWEELLFDSSLAEAIGKRGRDYVYEKFSAKRMAIAYTSLYKEMLVRT